MVGARAVVLEWERSRFIFCEFGRFMVDQCHEIFTLKFADVFAVVKGRGRGRDSGRRTVVGMDAKMHPQIQTYLKYDICFLFVIVFDFSTSQVVSNGSYESEIGDKKLQN